MAAINLTQKTIAQLVAAGEPAQAYDARAVGLVLRIGQKGRMSWSVVFRDAAGKRQRVTLRGADAASLDAARAAARRIVADAHVGRNAAEERRRDKAALTLADLLDEFFKAKNLKSAAHTRPSLDAHVIPSLGSKRADQISRGELALLLDRIAMGAGDRKPAPASANRVFDDLNAVFNWAVDREYVPANPMLRLARPAAKRARERVPSLDEMRAIVAKLPEAPFGPAMRRILHLLVLTACRASEIAELKKGEVDLAGAVIRLPGARTKSARPFTVPLVAPALEIIRDAIKDVEHSEYVFPSPRDWSKPIDGHAVSTAVRRSQGYFGIPHWTAHDFRRSIATNLSIKGVQPHVIEIVLNHASSGVTRKHYNLATYESEHREALKLWAELIAPARILSNV